MTLRRKRHSRKKAAPGGEGPSPNILWGWDLEPIVLAPEEVIDRLSAHEGVDAETAALVIERLRRLGLAVVERCNLCAEELPGRIPRCPNIATVEMRHPHGRSIMTGPLRVCAAHMRGEKIYVGRKK